MGENTHQNCTRQNKEDPGRQQPCWGFLFCTNLTQPTKKPDGTKLEEPPVPVDHESVEKPAEPEPDPGQPQAGDTSGNQIYVPGFGWVENHGGGGSGTVAEDMYENGNKIGIMD